MNLLIKRRCYHDVEKLLLMLMLRDTQTRKKGNWSLKKKTRN